MLIFNDVSASVKLWREQSYIILREWKAMTCRYRFILMGANTIRERHQWFSLMEFNDSIRFLSPLYRLSSKLSLHHHPHCLEKNKPSLWAWLSSGIYQSLLFDNQLLIIQRISFFVCSETCITCTKCEDSKSRGNCALQTGGSRQSSWMAVHCSVLMHYFLLVIFHTGTHLVIPVPLSCFPEGQFDLLSVWHALFWRGICGILKILRQMNKVCFVFLWKIYKMFISLKSFI